MTQRRRGRGSLTAVLAGILACGHDARPAGPDLTAPATIVVTPDSLRILVNDTARLRAIVLNLQGDTLANASVSFSSEDTAVAAVDAAGLVRARGGGRIYVRAISGDVTKDVGVHVRVNGTLEASPDAMLLTQRDTLQLTVVVRDSNGAVILGAPVVYRSLDTTIVRVSPSGQLMFGGSAGFTRIDIESSGRRDAVFVSALVDRVAMGGRVGPIAVLPSGEAFVGVGFGGDVTRFRLPSTSSTGGFFIGGIGSLGDISSNVAATHVWVTDSYWGHLLSVDLTGASGTDTIASSSTPYNPYGPMSAVVPPGDSLLYYYADGYIYGLRLASKTKIDSVAIVGQLLAIHDSVLYALWPVRGEIREYNIQRRSLGRVIKFGWSISDFVLSADGGRVYAVYGGAQDLRLFIWDRVSGDTLPSIELPAPNAFTNGATLAEQPSTGHVWVSADDAARVYVVDVAARKILRTLQPGGRPRGMGFTASGIGILANEDGWLDFIR
jgi:hypothetical protein